MVQRKAPNKLGIKPYLLKSSDTQLVKNLRPSSPIQSHDNKLKKIMKKSRPMIKRPDDSSRKKRSDDATTPQKQSPNYMKSTSSFDARKESSLTPSMKKSRTLTSGSSEKSKTSSLKLAKTPSFKPVRTLKKKVVLCEEIDARKATCSSTLKDSKFPNYLELSPGGTELNGTSAMKVCPYTYCSLNGHHHVQSPPLKCFLSARRRALKTQKSFKVGCLSPRQKNPVEPVIFEAQEEVNMEATPMNPLFEEEEEKENRDFFVEIYSKEEEKKEKVREDLECSDIDWEEGHCSDGDVCEEKIQKSLYGELQELYDEESVSSGAWSEEDGDSESESSFEDGDSSTSMESEVIDEMADDNKITSINEELKATNEGKNAGFDEYENGDQKIECSVNYTREETSRASENATGENKDDKHHTTIIYNIIQFNISVFINGVKTEDSKTEFSADKMETKEVNESMVVSQASELEQKQGMSNEEEEEDDDDDGDDEIIDSNQMIPREEQDVLSNEPEKEGDEITSETLATDSLNGFTRGKKPEQESDDLRDFNPRGPNFLPEVAEPDPETVDLRHQTINERKNAEEFMVDFALQKAVTTLAPERKKKVSLLVEAFEKVMPIPKYEPRKRHASKAFGNARPMQACS